jgi:hypothetical protein
MMIKIEYTLDPVEMEPGPNIYFMGKPEDYLKLLNDLHGLAAKNNTEIKLADLDYVELLEGISYIARSSEGGAILSKVEGKYITMDLDRELWKQILAWILYITFGKGHQYIEFDDLDYLTKKYDIKEDANVIMSSAWQ